MNLSSILVRRLAVGGLTATLASFAFAASWSPDGAHIAFSYIGGPEDIYVARADGSAIRPIVARPYRDFRPEWAPDGSHLVFAAVVDDRPVLMRVDPDGRNLHALSDVDDAAGDPDYSPDGEFLAYHTDEPRSRDLYLRRVTTGQVTSLTGTPDFDETSPRWSPDGRHIAFVGTEKRDGAEGDIWKLELGSGERQNLTRTPTVGEFHPEWSHDGTRIVYIRVEDGAFVVAVRQVGSDVETVVADGNGYAVLDPHFSPDDRSVTFTRTDFAEQGEGMPAIVRVNLADGAEVRLTQGRYLTQQAAGD